MAQDIKQTPLSRRKFLTGALAASPLIASPTILRAKPQTLLLSSWAPPGSLIAEHMAFPWVETLEEATEGRVKIEIASKPLGGPQHHHELLATNKIDLGYSLHSYTPDWYSRAKIGQFSGLGDAFSASQAFSKVYGKVLDASTEHKYFHLIGLYQHGPGVLMTRDKELKSPDDFKGMKIRTPGGYAGSLVSDLGCENVLMSPFKVGEALEAGEIDGVAFPYDAGFSWNIFDKVNFISELPGGYYNSTWFAGMSEAAKQKLDPQDLQNLTKASLQILPVLAAKAFDYVDYLAKEEFVKRGVQVSQTDDTLKQYVMAAASRHEAKWAQTVSGQGFDGARALSLTRRITSAF